MGLVGIGCCLNPKVALKEKTLVCLFSSCCLQQLRLDSVHWPLSESASLVDKDWDLRNRDHILLPNPNAPLYSSTDSIVGY